LDTAERAAAEFFRHQQAGKSHLGKLLPKLAGETGRVLGIAQSAQMRHRRLVCYQAARAVAQHRLFFCEDEGHGCFRLELDSSFRGASQTRTTVRTCAPENLEVPGSTLRVAPERRRTTPPADRGCAWRRCRASPPTCRPRSS